jgi:hypothetical protein
VAEKGRILPAPRRRGEPAQGARIDADGVVVGVDLTRINAFAHAIRNIHGTHRWSEK